MQKATRAEKALSALAYLPFLTLIPFFLTGKGKGTEFTLFHSKRGLLLFALECALLLPLFLLSQALGAFWYPLGTVVYILISLLALVFLFFALCGIFFAVRSQMRELPLFLGYTPKSSD